MKRMFSTLATAAMAMVLALAIFTTAGAATRTATSHAFTGTGSLGEYYTVQTVTGTFLTTKPVPTEVTVYNWQNLAVVSSAAPQLRRNYDGGYWKQTYHLNAWYVGRTTDAAYVLLLPDSRVGATFSGMLMTNFLPNNGNWQNWIDFTSLA